MSFHTHRVASVDVPVCTNINPIDTESNVILASTVPHVRPNPGVPCSKCGLYPHPLEAVRKLNPELQLALPTMNRHTPMSDGPSNISPDMSKRRRVVLDGCVINSTELIQQLKDKQKSGTTKKGKSSKKVYICFLP